MELLSLKWNNHRTAFFQVLKSLRSKETFTDATLVCDGQFLQVHKLVLITCSDYLSEIFEKITCKSPVVLINGMELKHLLYLLDYMYLGEVDVPQAELADLVKAAENLQIKGLAISHVDPTSSTSKRSIGSEENSPPKRYKSRESSGFSHTSVRTDSKNHSSEPLEKQERVYPMDLIKVEHDEASISTITQPEQFPSQDDSSLEEDFFNLSKDSYSGEEFSHKKDDSLDFLGRSTGVPWDSEHQSKDIQPAETSGTLHDAQQLRPNKDSTKHVCHACGKDFPGKAQLARHIKVHTGAKPFQCIVCSKIFNQRCSLKQHMIKHAN